MIPNEIINEILSRADIVQIIGNYINVVKKGRNYAAVCPFHDDSSPSLMISQEKQIFKCFVDGHGGNAIGFVQQYEKISFEEATKKVAELIGFDHESLHKKNYYDNVDEKIKRQYKCISDLNEYYGYTLLSEKGEKAYDYLTKRNITEEEMEYFQIGYSQQDGKTTIKYLLSKGHSLKSINDIGIASNYSEDASDKFQGRVIFSVHDIRGQVVGFSGRLLEKNDNSPKYVNSQETSIFHKGNVFYNLHNAVKIARQEKYIYLVEGFMDVIALYKVNIRSVIALMGTNITKEQIRILKSLNVEIRVCLDGDEAGQQASMKIVTMLNAAQVPCVIINNNNNSADTDEILNEHGTEALKSYLENIQSPFEFIINYYKKTNKLQTNSDKDKLINYFLKLILDAPSTLVYNDYIAKLSSITDYSIHAINEYVKLAKKKLDKEDSSIDIVIKKDIAFSTHIKNTKFTKIDTIELAIMQAIINDVNSLLYFDEKALNYQNTLYKDIAKTLIDYYDMNGKIVIPEIINYISNSNLVNKQEIYDMLLSISLRTNTPKIDDCLMNEYIHNHEVEIKKMKRENDVNQSLKGKNTEEQLDVLKQYIATKNEL